MAIEDILMGDETLFQNINAFNPDYMPENFNFRDSQMEGMAMCIRPAIQGGRPTNSVIMGSCATGKTTALKKVFELVEHTTDKVVCCYIAVTLIVNCTQHVLESFLKFIKNYLDISLQKLEFLFQECMKKL